MREVAMQLTLKAMESGLIPFTRLEGSDEIDTVRNFNAGQVAKFYNALLKELKGD